jgi:hypothetical protein
MTITVLVLPETPSLQLQADGQPQSQWTFVHTQPPPNLSKHKTFWLCIHDPSREAWHLQHIRRMSFLKKEMRGQSPEYLTTIFVDNSFRVTQFPEIEYEEGKWTYVPLALFGMVPVNGNLLAPTNQATAAEG